MIIVSQDKEMIINFNNTAGIFLETIKDESIIEVILERSRVGYSKIQNRRKSKRSITRNNKRIQINRNYESNYK